MPKDIVEQNKREVAAKRGPKTIEVNKMWQFIATVIITSVIVAFASITINNAINSNIDSQVKAQVEAQLKLEK